MKQIGMYSFFILMIFVSSGMAQGVPQLLDHQGFLTDVQGTPVTGTHTIEFRIYDAATNGNLLWTETLQVVVDAGLYHVLLGATAQLDNLFDGSTKYLALEVQGDGEMTPRQQLVSVPHAMVSSGAHVGQTCPVGQALVGFDGTGQLVCQ